MLLKKFFTAHDAAQWLAQKSGEPMQADDVHRLAEAGALPICFKFRGNLGVFDRPTGGDGPTQSAMRAVFAPAKLKAYFPAGYLRASGGVQLGAVVERLRVVGGGVQQTRAKVNNVGVGAVTIAEPGRGFARIEFDPVLEQLWPLRADGQRSIGELVGASEWLFHVDDLERLARPVAPVAAVVAIAPEIVAQVAPEPAAGDAIPDTLAPAPPSDGSDDLARAGNAPALPWWRQKHDIHEMAQTIGEKLCSDGRRTSNAAISKEIAKRIKQIEHSKGSDRATPNHDTVRGVLTGWKFKPA